MRWLEGVQGACVGEGGYHETETPRPGSKALAMGSVGRQNIREQAKEEECHGKLRPYQGLLTGQKLACRDKQGDQGESPKGLKT